MEPRIQYAQTADGVSIAFWTLGEGMPLVHMPGDVPLSHIQLEWQYPRFRSWYERLSGKRMVVRYDGRGTGLSDRDVPDHSLDACVLDLQAVVDRVRLEKFALFASYGCGLVAVAYAARHPERVSHLILWSCAARASDWLMPRDIHALDALLNVDWHTATETWARLQVGEAKDQPRRLLAAYMRECTTLEVMRGVIEAFREVDVRSLLPQLRSPTLVLGRRQIPNRDNVRLARDLASRIPDASLLLMEGSLTAPQLGDSEAVLAAIDEFLGGGEEAAAGAGPLAKEDVHTILFTDMEGSTILTQRLGDAKAQEVLRSHNTIVRDALKAHSGSEIKHTGDGIMASFTSASRALECAIAIQRALAQHNESAEEPIRVRIGLNAGEPVAEEQDLFGTAVQLAARICGQTEPDQILASNVVRELAAGKGFLFSDRGDVALRGFEDPVRLYEVRWREA